MPKIPTEIIKAYTLKNALEHEGKAIAGSVINSLFNEGLKKQDIKIYIPIIQEVLNEINNWDPEVQNKEYKLLQKYIQYREEREGLPELPNNKKVITRMSPSPSGLLHIGHILAILPNFLYAQKYKGTFYIRIEDTNPENIYPPAYKMIKEEAKWLCKNKVKFLIQSKRMEIYYKYIEKLINKKFAYICTCDPEIFKELILKKKACPCRNLDLKEQKKRWKNMLNFFEPGEAVLKFKADLNDKNPAMRDFSLARVNTAPHPLQKHKYRVWPLMNLAVTVDDIEQGMTHIIRGKDHKDNAKRQEMIYKALGKSKIYPYIDFIGRVHFKGFNLSASKMRKDFELGIYKSWDDPALPTVAALKKQGYKPETFYKFGEQRGISEVDKEISKKDFFEILNNFENKG